MSAEGQRSDGRLARYVPAAVAVALLVVTLFLIVAPTGAPPSGVTTRGGPLLGRCLELCVTNAVVSPSGTVAATFSVPAGSLSETGRLVAEANVESTGSYWADTYGSPITIHAGQSVNLSVGTDPTGATWNPPLHAGERYIVVVLFYPYWPCTTCVSLINGTIAVPSPFNYTG